MNQQTADKILEWARGNKVHRNALHSKSKAIDYGDLILFLNSLISGDECEHENKSRTNSHFKGKLQSAFICNDCGEVFPELDETNEPRHHISCVNCAIEWARQYESDEEIALRKMYDYISENVTDYKNEPVILDDVIDWLSKKGE